MGYQGSVAPCLFPAPRRVAPGILLLPLLLGACEVPKEINPVWIYDQVSGRADRARPAPPGLDRPFPNLASVPPRPEKPPLAVREQLSAALATDRTQSRSPLEPRAGAAEPSFAPAPGTPPLPGRPPPPPQLAGARPIPWDGPDVEPTAPGQRAAPPAGTAPAGPASGPAPTVPASRPSGPPPDLLAPPPPPSRDLLAPPPLPSRDLLAPPPPPSPDLLAPPARR